MKACLELLFKKDDRLISWTHMAETATSAKGREAAAHIHRDALTSRLPRMQQEFFNHAVIQEILLLRRTGVCQEDKELAPEEWGR